MSGCVSGNGCGKASTTGDIFKRNVRSLKAMGLTLSQRVGYRLSPRGRAYLELSRR